MKFEVQCDINDGIVFMDPDLEMETIGELELENGSYKIGLHSDGMIGIKKYS